MGLLQSVDDGRCLLLVGSHAEFCSIYFGYIQHMMGDPLHLFAGGFGRSNVQPSIDLNGICGDDLPAQAFCHLHPQAGLAAGGRPQDDP